MKIIDENYKNQYLLKNKENNSKIKFWSAMMNKSKIV